MSTTFTPAFDINPTGTTPALGRELRLRRLFAADGRTLTVALDQPEQLLALLFDLARRTVAPYDVPVCTMLAIVAWLRGDGGLANVALERAWRGDPTYSLAALVRDGLDQQVPPAEVREWLRGTRRALRRTRRKGSSE